MTIMHTKAIMNSGRYQLAYRTIWPAIQHTVKNPMARPVKPPNINDRSSIMMPCAISASGLTISANTNMALHESIPLKAKPRHNAVIANPLHPAAVQSRETSLSD